jgi:hypothetical protein
MWSPSFLRSAATPDLPLVYLPRVRQPWCHLQLHLVPSQPDNTLLPILWCQSRCLLLSWSLLAPSLIVYAVLGIKRSTILTTSKVSQKRKPPGKGNGAPSRLPLVNVEGAWGAGLASKQQGVERDHILGQSDTQ